MCGKPRFIRGFFCVCRTYCHFHRGVKNKCCVYDTKCYLCGTQLEINIMTTLKNATGSKAVNITTDATGNVRAVYVQIYDGEQQVLRTKTFSTTQNAKKWAKKILNKYAK